jgi:S1-C subfamily serine protease
LHGFLGVELQDQSSTSRFGFGGGIYGDGFGGDGFGGDGTISGALVGGVLESGSAARIGLEAGDVITSVNGHTVDGATKLNSLMAATKPGQKVKIGWTDIEGQRHTGKVTLGAAAAD